MIDLCDNEIIGLAGEIVEDGERCEVNPGWAD
jgi:hypothetical protein